MSSVAVLTQESFAEHRSGLVPQQIRGDVLPGPGTVLSCMSGPECPQACVQSRGSRGVEQAKV